MVKLILFFLASMMYAAASSHMERSTREFQDALEYLRLSHRVLSPDVLTDLRKLYKQGTIGSMRRGHAQREFVDRVNELLPMRIIPTDHMAI